MIIYSVIGRIENVSVILNEKEKWKIITHLRGLYEIHRDMSAPYLYGTRTNNIMGYGRAIYIWSMYTLRGVYEYLYVLRANLRMGILLSPSVLYYRMVLYFLVIYFYNCYYDMDIL